MNKKLIALVAALFVTTCAQATIYERNFTQTWPTEFESVKHTAALANALEKKDFREAYNQEKNFQQNIQLAALAGSGVVITTFFCCVFAEWLQEFKLRKAEKAKLIARLQCEAREIRTTCYTA
jgi:hypothetical protein